METIQKDRATGTLHMRGADGDATLYFLFGHLFHAIDGGDAQGEPVVHKVLGWSDGEFSFDAKAKLPAEETIKVSTAEILANRDAAMAASSNGTAPPMEVTEPAADTATAASSPEPEPESVPEEPPSAGDGETAAEAAAERRRRRTDQIPGTRPPETMVLYPVPLGTTIHEGLTAGFVDFPKLLRSLAKDKHSGYVRLTGENFVGVLLFSSGAVVEALYDGDQHVSTGSDAFHLFGDRIDEGDGSLDVVQLSAEMVTGIYQLLTANSVYDKLLARFIKADALLEYLTEQGTSGAVIVRHEASTGIVLFRDGEILGTYTDTSREVDASPKKVVALCENPTAEVEVRGGPLPATLPVMEPDSQGGLREVPSGSSSSTPAPRAAAARATAASAPKAVPVAAAKEAAQPEPEAEDAPSEPAARAKAAAPKEADWGAAINEMAGRADAVLGTRAKKVKELLYASGHSRADVDGTIEKIAELSIMFVDPSKLSSLAEEFRQVAERTG